MIEAHFEVVWLPDGEIEYAILGCGNFAFMVPLKRGPEDPKKEREPAPPPKDKEWLLT